MIRVKMLEGITDPDAQRTHIEWADEIYAVVIAALARVEGVKSKLGNDTSKPMDWRYPMAEDELRRLSGERNLPTFQEADPRIPVDARPLFGFARQYADGCN